MLQVSKGKFDGFPDIELEEFSAGLTYKAKSWYLKMDGLIYIAKKFTHQFEIGVLTVPKHTDVIATFHLGTSF
jgi:hypothetical protein